MQTKTKTKKKTTKKTTTNGSASKTNVAPKLLKANGSNGFSAITRAYEGIALMSFTESNAQGDLNADGGPSIDAATGHERIRPTKWNRAIRDFFTFEGKRILLARGRQAIRDDHETMTIDDMVQIARDEIGMGVSKEYILSRFGKVAAQKHKGGSSLTAEEAHRLWTALIESYYDLKFFGGLLNVGSDKLANVCGAVKIHVARSVCPVMIIDDSVTRGMITNEGERKKRSRTIGSKTTVPFALFPVPFAVVPCHAKETGFSNEDLYEFIRAFLYILPNEQSSYRRGVLHGFWLFQSPNHLMKRPVGRDWLNTVVKIESKLDDPMTVRSIDDFDVTVDTSALPDGVRMFDLNEITKLVDDRPKFLEAL